MTTSVAPVRSRVHLIVDVQLHELHTAVGFCKALQNDLNWAVSDASKSVTLVSNNGQQAQLAVEINLDMAPSWAHDPKDWQEWVQKRLSSPGMDRFDHPGNLELPLSAAQVTIA